MPVRVFNIDEAASILKLHPQTVWKMLNSSELKGSLVKGQWRIPSTSICQALDLPPETDLAVDPCTTQEDPK